VGGAVTAGGKPPEIRWGFAVEGGTYLEDAPRVLLVQADEALVNTFQLVFNHAGYDLRTERSLSGARSALTNWRPHLLLLDMDIEPGALALIDEIHAAGRTGVIALTQRRDLPLEVDAFEHGADDYIVGPFVPADVIARTRAVLRRSHHDPGRFAPRQRFGDLEINISGRIVIAGGQEVHLTSLEQVLLYVFIANAGRVLDRGEILEAVWGAEFVTQTNLVDKHVRALRRKLKDDWRKPRYIQTVAGTGYRLVPTTE
jgi:DNA-binding response OmpR family regulator